MPDYSKIIGSIEKAEACLRKAEESMVPISTVKQIDAYMLGLLQSVRLILTDTKRAAKAANKVADKPPTLPRKLSRLT